MKKLLLVCFVIFGMALSSCTVSIATDPLQTTSEQGGDQDGIGARGTITVRGREIPSEGQVWPEIRDGEQSYVMLPLAEVLKAMGATVVWQSDSTATVTFGDGVYVLNTQDTTFKKEGQDCNALIPAPGSTMICRTVEGVFYVDSITFMTVTMWIGMPMRVIVHAERLAVEIVDSE